jgi:hypothetical protein
MRLAAASHPPQKSESTEVVSSALWRLQMNTRRPNGTPPSVNPAATNGRGACYAARLGSRGSASLPDEFS